MGPAASWISLRYRACEELGHKSAVEASEPGASTPKSQTLQLPNLAFVVYKYLMYRLENQLMAMALHLHDRMSLAARRELGHSVTDASALVLVWNNGPLPIQLFARTLAMSHPAAVQQIDRLCADGLLERAVGSDRRYRPVRLTGKGKTRVRAFLKARSAIAREVFAQFSIQDRAALERLTSRILSASAKDRLTVDRLCRCCDEQACPPQFCPAERQVAQVPSPLTTAHV